MEELWNKIVEYLATNGLDLLKSIVLAAVIFLVGRWIAKVVTKLADKAMEKGKVEATLRKFAKNLIYTTLLVFVIIAALSKLIGKDSSGQFVAVVGAAGLAIGFALQGSLSNFAAGVLLIIFKPFKVGDLVEVAGSLGVVKEIAIFTTTLHSPDNIKIIIPNAQATGGNIKNYSATGTRRVDLVIGVSYEDNMKTARDIMMKVLTADSRVLAEPAPTVAVSELGDSSVNFVVRPWVNVADYWDVYFDATEKIKVALEEGGCTIPFPQRDVHMISQPAG
jgi:small conductance mechanosensitive channel